MVGGIACLAVGLVALTLVRPEPPTFAPSHIGPPEREEAPRGPVTYTVDASDPDRWVYFSFSSGSVVHDPGRFEWDLAFRRFRVIANGGEGFPGMAGILDLGEVTFDAVGAAPPDGYDQTLVQQGDSVHPVAERWYDYSFFSHLLSPRPRVYALRTADGRYAKLEFLGYYCPGARPGCVTFRYEYQPEGGTSFDSAPLP